MKRLTFSLLVISLATNIGIEALSQGTTIVAGEGGNLEVITKKLAAGVFVRNMPQYDPEKLETKDTSQKQPLYLSNTYYFFRFDSIFAADATKQLYLAKLFVSERVFESTYQRRYKSPTDYKSETRGLYIMAKIYQENKDKIRIKVYPTYTTNIVSKKMYRDAAKTKDYTTHLNRLVEEVKDTNLDSLFFKEIKCFDLEMRKDTIEGLRLAFTKYSHSDDEITNTSYFLKFSTYQRLLRVSNLTIVQQFQEERNDPADQVVAQHSVLKAENNTQPLVIVGAQNGIKSDTLVSLQSLKPVNAVWVYAGMRKEAIWKTQYVQLDDEKQTSNSKIATALYRLQLREEAPRKEANTWQKGKIIYVCEKGQKMEILDRLYISYIKDSTELLWLKVKLL
ncbi:MAG: hypothetical protein R2822_21160 [Spirosomataceae bacterium]